VYERVDDVDRVAVFGEHEEGVPRRDCQGVLGRQFDESRVVAGFAHEAGADASQNASPKRSCALTPASASWTSSIVLMKWA
jgi:hypothetical protein